MFADTVTVDGTSLLRAQTPREEDESPRALHVHATDVTVAGTLHADAAGYVGAIRSNGRTQGNVDGASANLGSPVDIGGSYGGHGWSSNAFSDQNPLYGDFRFPDEFGSSGSTDSTSCRAGHGGGKLVLAVSGTLTVEGRIGADGDNGCDSGGSGGAVRIELGGTGTVAGDGSITARGGSVGRDGGGGRIALLDFAGDLPELLTITARGGDSGSDDGGPGTVFLRSVGTVGRLHAVNAGSTAHYYTTVAAPMELVPTSLEGSTLAFAGESFDVPGPVLGDPGLEGYVALVTTSRDEQLRFAVATNTVDSLTLEDPNGDLPALQDIAQVDLLVDLDALDFDDGARVSVVPGVSVRGAIGIDAAAWLRSTRVFADDISLTDAARLLCLGQRSEDDMPRSLRIAADTVSVDETSRIDADATGYRGRALQAGLTFGNTDVDGAGFEISGSNRDVGGSYGGYGHPRASNGDGLGFVYGDFRYPDEFGSAGGTDSTTRPGDGGGKLVLEVSSSLQLDGNLTADGEARGDSSGSGGAIRVDLLGTGSLSGLGGLYARGGNTGLDGGGGRIAVLDYQGELPAFLFGAWGGDSSSTDGGVGTVYTRAAGMTHGDLLMDNAGGNSWHQRTELFPALPARYGPPTGIGGGMLVDNGADWPVAGEPSSGSLGLEGMTLYVETTLGNRHFFPILANDATSLVLQDDGGTLPADAADVVDYQILPTLESLRMLADASVVSGGVEVLGDCDMLDTDPRFGVIRADELVVRGDSIVRPPNREEDGTPRGLYIGARRFELQAGTSVDLNGTGYLGVTTGSGITNGGVPADGGANNRGGSYGGLGEDRVEVDRAYGAFFYPDEFGSGGGSTTGTRGGDGGGRFIASVSETLVLDGAVQANGTTGAGEGSGGGVRFELLGAAVSGIGSISALGASGNDGGGGRIALLDYASNTDTIAIDARGGSSGTQKGGAGTIFLRAQNTEGTLIVDNDGITGGNLTPLVFSDTPLDALDIRGNAAVCAPDAAPVVATVEAGSTFDENDDACQ